MKINENFFHFYLEVNPNNMTTNLDKVSDKKIEKDSQYYASDFEELSQ